MLLDVLVRDAAVWSGALDLVDVDADFTRETTDGGRRGQPPGPLGEPAPQARRRWLCGTALAPCGCGASRLGIDTTFCSCFCSGFLFRLRFALSAGSAASRARPLRLGLPSARQRRFRRPSG